MCREVAVLELAAWNPGVQQVQMWVCDLVMSRLLFLVESLKLKVENLGMENNIQDKSFAFAVRIVNLCKMLREQRREYVLSKQLLRSGTSIGANIMEAQNAQSRADFCSKLNIALKETTETRYWLRLLEATGYLSKMEFDSIYPDCVEIEKILVASVKSIKQ